MKGISIFLLVVGCLAIANQATYLRVIHAVPSGDMRMDVYYTAVDTGEKIRLFQDLNYTDIPPHFFIPVIQNTELVTLSFKLKQISENETKELFSQQELQDLPSHRILLRKDLAYSLVVTAPASDMEEQIQGSNQLQEMNLEYLLLSDRVPGDEAPQGNSFIRLINLAEDSTSISLIEENGKCSQENETSGNQSQENETQENETQGNQMDPLSENIEYLQASDYIQLPENSKPLNLFVCHQGQKIPIIAAPMFQESADLFSILLFTGIPNQQAQGNEAQGNETQGNEAQGNEAQGNQNQEQGNQNEGNQEQGNKNEGQGNQNDEGNQNEVQTEYFAFIVSDTPVTTENVKIRIVHAASEFQAVDVMLDGKILFNGVTFGNVTEYSLTVRGIHNISVMETSRRSSEAIKIFTFLAWSKSYTIAIVKTNSGIIGMESQGNQSENQGNQSENQGNQENEGQSQGNDGENAGQRSATVVFPGFLGPNHKIFLDDFEKNATIGSVYAYIRVIHLVSDIGPVDVSIGNNKNISNIQFLQPSLYTNVESSFATIKVMLSGSDSALFTLRKRLQAGTLYTLWALQETSGDAKIFLTTDRRVQVQCTVMDIQGEQGGNQQGNQGGSQQGNEGDQESGQDE